MRGTYRAALAAMLFTGACAAPPEVAAPEMSQEEMMQRMAQLATPSSEHQRLLPTVGEFRTKGQFWTDPSAEPLGSDGVSKNTWVLGGRFVQQEYDGSFMGQPFRGMGLTGFNNATGHYEAIWVDSMGTMIMPVSTGTCDASGKVFTFTRDYEDPLTGQTMTTREVLTVVDDRKHTFEWFTPSPDGVGEFRMMKLEYDRVR